MKQFSLEEYHENPSRKVVTREGRSARIICTDQVSKNYPLLALVMMEDKEIPFSYTRNGQFYENNTNGLDLFFVSEKHEGWINIYPDHATGLAIYKSEKEAKDCANTEVIATIKIEWKE